METVMPAKSMADSADRFCSASAAFLPPRRRTSWWYIVLPSRFLSPFPRYRVSYPSLCPFVLSLALPLLSPIFPMSFSSSRDVRVVAIHLSVHLSISVCVFYSPRDRANGWDYHLLLLLRGLRIYPGKWITFVLL